MLLSIVIPFYNVERYIGACLERAARLPQDACELLLVDDCGCDGSAEIAQAFCRIHQNARIIRRAQNGGLSAARNTGFDEAKGEYVYYLDSDDLPEPDALIQLAHEAQRMQLDVAKARFVFFDDETGKEMPGPAVSKTEVMMGAELFAAQCRADVYEPMVWQCVYRKSFLERIGLCMADGLLFEDELFQAPALLSAERAAAFECVILRYRQREGSIMKSFARSSRWCASYLEVCRRLHAIAQGVKYAPARRAMKRRIGQIALSTVKNIPAYGLQPEVEREAMEFARQNLRELSGYAIGSGDLLVTAQGLLMRASLAVFIYLYSKR